MTQYYAGVYQDDKGKVFQVSDSVDGLSCEILADPGVKVTKVFHTVKQMIDSAKTAGRFLMCHHLEVNCSRGNGSYQWLKV